MKNDKVWSKDDSVTGTGCSKVNTVHFDLMPRSKYIAHTGMIYVVAR